MFNIWQISDFAIVFSFILISTKVWLFAWWLFRLFLFVSWVILNNTSVHVSPCIRSCLVMTRHLLVHCVILEIFVPGLCSQNSNFRIHLQLWASELFAPAPNIYVFLNPAPEWFGPQNTKTIVLFIQLSCLTNCVYETRKQISGSGSTIWKFLALTLTPAIQNCLCSSSWLWLQNPQFCVADVTWLVKA